MPRLGSFLACEKVIQDQLGKPTLIGLFQKISALVPAGQELPKDTLAAIAWSIFCEWFFTEEELTKKWEQVMEVTLPDGSPSPIRGRLPLKELAPFGHGSRTFTNMMGIPVTQVGFLAVNVWLEQDSERKTDVYSYHIIIEHSSQPPTPNDGGQLIPTIAPRPSAIPKP